MAASETGRTDPDSAKSEECTRNLTLDKEDSENNEIEDLRRQLRDLESLKPQNTTLQQENVTLRAKEQKLRREIEILQRENNKLQSIAFGRKQPIKGSLAQTQIRSTSKVQPTEVAKPCHRCQNLEKDCAKLKAENEHLHDGLIYCQRMVQEVFDRIRKIKGECEDYAHELRGVGEGCKNALEDLKLMIHDLRDVYLDELHRQEDYVREPEIKPQLHRTSGSINIIDSRTTSSPDRVDDNAYTHARHGTTEAARSWRKPHGAWNCGGSNTIAPQESVSTDVQHSGHGSLGMDLERLREAEERQCALERYLAREKEIRQLQEELQSCKDELPATDEEIQYTLSRFITLNKQPQKDLEDSKIMYSEAKQELLSYMEENTKMREKYIAAQEELEHRIVECSRLREELRGLQMSTGPEDTDVTNTTLQQEIDDITFDMFQNAQNLSTQLSEIEDVIRCLEDKLSESEDVRRCLEDRLSESEDVKRCLEERLSENEDVRRCLEEKIRDHEQRIVNLQDKDKCPQDQIQQYEDQIVQLQEELLRHQQVSHGNAELERKVWALEHEMTEMTETVSKNDKQLVNLEKEKTNLQNQIREVTDENRDLKETYERHNYALQRLQGESTEWNTKVRELQHSMGSQTQENDKELNQLRSDKDHLEREMQALESKVEDLQTILKEREETIAQEKFLSQRLNQKVSERDKLLMQMENTNEHTKTALKDEVEKVAKMQRQLQDKEAEVSALHKQIEELSASLHKIQQALEDEQNKRSDNEKDLDEIDDKYQHVKQLYHGQKKKIEEALKQIEELKEFQHAEQQALEKERKKRSDKEKDLDELDDKYQHVKQLYHDQKKKIESLEDTIQQLTESLHVEQQALEEERKKRRDKEKDLDELDDKYKHIKQLYHDQRKKIEDQKDDIDERRLYASPGEGGRHNTDTRERPRRDNERSRRDDERSRRDDERARRDYERARWDDERPGRDDERTRRDDENPGRDDGRARRDDEIPRREAENPRKDNERNTRSISEGRKQRREDSIGDERPRRDGEREIRERSECGRRREDSRGDARPCDYDKSECRSRSRDKYEPVARAIYDSNRAHVVMPLHISLDTQLVNVIPLLEDKWGVDICARPASRLRAEDLIVVPCISPSLCGSPPGARNLLNLPRSIKACLLVFHHMASHNHFTVPTGRKLDANLDPLCLCVVDIVYWNNRIYDCDTNRAALRQLKALSSGDANRL